jgi:hypothetical protein
MPSFHEELERRIERFRRSLEPQQQRRAGLAKADGRTRPFSERVRGKRLSVSQLTQNEL